MSSRATARVPMTHSTSPTRTAATRTTGTRTAPRATPRPQLSMVAAPVARPRRSPRTALRSRRAPFVLLVVALLAGTTLGLLVLNTAIAVDSLQASRLRADNAQRAQDVQRLEQRVIDGNTPAAIARAAEAAGLVPAGGAAYLVLDADGAPVLRGEPSPAEAPPAPEPLPAPAGRPAGGN